MPMKRTSLAPWLALALLMACAGPAAAQDFAAAGKRFAAAQQAFAKGQFAVAAAEYQASYDISRDPSVLANIGESWDKAGDPRKAVEAYRKYVGEAPRAADRPKVETRIRELETKHGIPAPTPAPIQPPLPPNPGPAAAAAPAPPPRVARTSAVAPVERAPENERWNRPAELRSPRRPEPRSTP